MPMPMRANDTSFIIVAPPVSRLSEISDPHPLRTASYHHHQISGRGIWGGGGVEVAVRNYISAQMGRNSRLFWAVIHGSDHRAG